MKRQIKKYTESDIISARTIAYNHGVEDGRLASKEHEDKERKILCKMDAISKISSAIASSNESLARSLIALKDV